VAGKRVLWLYFALAKKIEDVVMWDAAATSGGVFEGTPDDPRFKYIKQDT